MELTFLHFLIVCPLVGIAGFIDSIAGGGGLISLPAYLISGLPVHTCIATNKLSSSMGTTVATTKSPSPAILTGSWAYSAPLPRWPARRWALTSRCSSARNCSAC